MALTEQDLERIGEMFDARVASMMARCDACRGSVAKHDKILMGNGEIGLVEEVHSWRGIKKLLWMVVGAAVVTVVSGVAAGAVMLIKAS